MTNLEIRSEPKGDAWVIRLKGFLDAHNHGLFREAVQEHTQKGHRRLIVDFSELTYIGSSGIEVILSHIQPLRDDGGDMILCCMSPKIFKVFDLLGLPSFFTICPTVEEASKAFHG
ncbi:MAG: STAS domain-containing protein [Acidobacteriota bacterium]